MCTYDTFQGIHTRDPSLLPSHYKLNFPHRINLYITLSGNREPAQWNFLKNLRKSQLSNICAFIRLWDYDYPQSLIPLLKQSRTCLVERTNLKKLVKNILKTLPKWALSLTEA